MKYLNLNLSLLFYLLILNTAAYSQQVPANKDSGVKLFFEKAYLFTDRSYYSAGDDIWYSAFLLNGQTNLLSSTSNNLYVEIISPSSEVLERKMIHLNNGLGKGDFKLGDSIPSGKYRLRAYTNWMRNFGDEFFFEKELAVISSAFPNGQTAVAGKAEAINFFPEGGSMVEGVLGIVAFKAEDAVGKGLEVTGNIETADGTVITALNTSFNGMGRFLLQPEAGKKYRAKGKYSNGKDFNVELPSALSTGYGLYVRQSDSLFTIQVKTNERTYSALSNKEVVVLLKNKGKVYSSFKVSLSSVQTSFQISKIGIPSGISSLTIYDSAGRPSCERLINIEATDHINLTLTTDKTVYKQKEQTMLKIRTSDERNLPVKSNLSLAVVDASLIPDDVQGNIISYLNLQSEIKGLIENPGQYFDAKSKNRNSQLDLLLLCSGWRDFIWKRLADAQVKLAFHAEKGVSVMGKVKTKYGDKPLPNANITLSASSARGNKLFITQSDDAGVFYIDGVKLFGYQPVKITSVDSKAQKQGFIYIDTLNVSLLPQVKPLAVVTHTVNNSKMLSEINKRRTLLANQSLSDTLQLNEVVIKSSKKTLQLRDLVLNDFSYKEDEFTIKPSDYDYNDLRHFLTHRLNYNTSIVNDNIRTDKGTGDASYTPNFPRMIVNNREMPYTDEDPPELIRDYIDVYYGLKMSNVKYVKVKRMVGMDINTGKSKEVFVLYLTVNMSAIRGSEEGIISREVQGYYESRVFYEPNYTVPSSRADVRSTIHWQPLIATNANGDATLTYYNADPKSKIRIVAEGISETGMPFAGTINYEVK